MIANNIEDSYPLSHMQKGMLFHSLHAERSGVDIEQMVWVLREELSVPDFRKAWEQIIQRHPVLRTVFRWEGLEEPFQDVHRKVPFAWEEQDLRGVSVEKQTAQLDQYLRTDRQRGFDLSRPPLFRFAFFHLADLEYRFIWSFHHALLDGRSFLLLIKEFFFIYGAIRKGMDVKPEEAPPYRAYIEWLQKQDLRSAESFWRGTLSGFSAPTPFLGDEVTAARTSSPGSDYRERETCLSMELTAKLRALAQTEEVTLNTLVQGAWAILLSRYSGLEDVVFGATRACRRSTINGAESVVGLFINTLPMRVRLPGALPLGVWLRDLRKQQIAIRDYEHTPLVKVQAWSDVPRGQPLFESILVFENYLLDSALRAQGGEWERRAFRLYERTNYPLTLAAWGGEELALRLAYQRNRFDEAGIGRMLGHLSTLLEQMAESPQRSLSEIRLLTAPEQHQLIVEWNRTSVKYPEEERLHVLFENQVDRSPDAVAIVFEDQSWTYQEVNRRANQLANHLRVSEVRAEMLVGVYLERSLEMVVGILGVLKAGAAYLPLDPGYPPERLSFMLEDSQAGVLLTKGDLELPPYKGKIIRLDTDKEIIEKNGAHNPANRLSPDQIAYVIYTSGSTGKPKGVMISHRSICNHLSWRQGNYPLLESDRFLQKASLSFDISVWEIFAPLCNGAQLILAKPGGQQEADYLLKLIGEQNITVAHFGPATLQILVDDPAIKKCKALRQVFCGGEPLTSELRDRFYERVGAELLSQYGPTETCVDVTCCSAGDENNAKIIPIGRPIANTQIYLLDRWLNPVPIGIPGEMHVAGHSLARGYLNRPDFSAERFIPNPFSTQGGSRLYRTGDRARFSVDGNIEFLGRIDQQVKIRGFRVELGEIESALRQHPTLRDAAVLLREDHPGDKRLVAYVVPKEQGLTAHLLRQFLKERLPDYMMPSAFVFLEALPLTRNGKLDREGLPRPQEENQELQRSYVAPRTSVEEELAKIWEEVLRVARVGVHDNFFDLGGDSILSMQIASRAGQAGLRLSTKQLFQLQTIAGLAGAIQKIETSPTSERGALEGTVPLTPIQCYFFEQNYPEPHHWNMAVMLEIKRMVDPSVLEKVLRQLEADHDALRIRFVCESGVWRQFYSRANLGVPLVYADLSNLPETERTSALQEKTAQWHRSLNLSEGPLFLAGLFHLATNQPQRLLLIIHHLIVDGVSWRILLEDMQTCYDQISTGNPAKLPPKTTPYGEWSRELGRVSDAEPFCGEQFFWKEVAKKPVPPIPIDFQNGQNNEASARIVSVSLTAEETLALLQHVPAVYQTRINDVLLTALAQAFWKWTGRGLLRMDLEGHGREEIVEGIDLSRTVGWFTTIFPVFLDLGPRVDSLKPREALMLIKEQLRRIPNHGIGYGMLRYLSSDPALRTALGSAPRSQVSFNYLGQFGLLLRNGSHFGTIQEFGGMNHSPQGQRDHLIDINGLVSEERLRLDWTYSENFHHRSTIERLSEDFLIFLRSIIAHARSEKPGGYTSPGFSKIDLSEADLSELVAGLGESGEQQGKKAANKENIEDIYPLAPIQEGILFHSLFDPKSSVYRTQYLCNLRGDLNASLFQEAWQTVVAHQAILRTAFVWKQQDKPFQLVQRQATIPWENLDWRDQPATCQAEKLESLLQSDRKAGFDFAKAPLMRFKLIRLHDDDYQFIWTHHHLLLDGWSLHLLLKEVFVCYEASQNGGPLPLPLGRPYRDYVSWLFKQSLSEAELFWRNQLQGFTAPTPLSVDRKTAPTGGAEENYAVKQITVTPSLTAQAQIMARQHRVTMNTLLQATWALILSRYSGQDDLIFGITVSSRPVSLPGAESMIGLFINTLPFRVHIPENDQVSKWLIKLRDQQIDLQHFENTSLARIQSWSEVPGGLPLFESIMVFENYPIDDTFKRLAKQFGVRNVHFIEKTNYPLTLSGSLQEDLVLALSYDKDRFDEASIIRMLGHYETLLQAIVSDPQQPLAELALLSKAERQQLLVDWNTPPEHSLRDKCLPELFEEQVERTPAATAVSFEDQHLTYAELNCRANQVAHHLQSVGVGPETLVGLYIDRSPEMVIGLLGVLKAGGAYVPLDPAYPQERISFMLKDARLSILLTKKCFLPQLVSQEIAVYCLDAADGPFFGLLPENQSNINSGVEPANLAYLIYTSGSTGKPKAVMVQHKALVSFTRAASAYYEMSASDRVLQFASISFDASAEEIYCTLTRGSTLVLRTDQMLASIPAFLHRCREWRLTVISLPTAFWHELVSCVNEQELELPEVLRLVIIGGERALPERMKVWRKHARSNLRLVNSYGPTETTIVATVWDLPLPETEPSWSEVPIGRPLRDLETFILDRRLRLLPIGVSGELYIGGAGVARGYLKRPELTAEKFVAHPFSGEPGERLYKTGDLARYLSDGSIEYCGRIDDQVKLRGFRIELGEIETMLALHPGIKSVLVIVREDVPGEKQLIAYVIPAGGNEIPVKDLREFANQRLPAYMIPSAFVPLAAFPLTPSGKIDRARLPRLDRKRTDLEEQIATALTPIEEAVAEIWSKVLGLEQAGIHDDFFAAGGHSLLAIQLFSRLNATFHADLPIRFLFEAPTIAGLARLIDEECRKQPSSVQSARSHWSYLTPIQALGAKRPFYFLPGGLGSEEEFLVYARMARYLGFDQPFYGLKARDVHGGEKPHSSVVEMAAAYLEEIKAFQPCGPYSLVGECAGGLVAFEMARQLQARGASVALVALLDCQCPRRTEYLRHTIIKLKIVLRKQFLVRALYHLRRLLKITSGQRLPYFYQQAAKAKHRINSALGLTKKENQNPTEKVFTDPRFHSYFQTLIRYRPKRYSGKLTLLANEDLYKSCPTLGWSELAKGGLEVHQLPGNHITYIRQHVQSAAEMLKECLEKTRG